MDQFMAYTLLPERPQSNPYVVVIYDNISDKFIVNYTKSGVEYFSAHAQEASDYTVRYSDLVNKTFKYTNEVINGILSRIPDTVDDIPVYFSNGAINAVHLVVNGNRELY